MEGSIFFSAGLKWRIIPSNFKGGECNYHPQPFYYYSFDLSLAFFFFFFERNSLAFLMLHFTPEYWIKIKRLTFELLFDTIIVCRERKPTKWIRREWNEKPGILLLWCKYSLIDICCLKNKLSKCKQYQKEVTY